MKDLNDRELNVLNWHAEGRTTKEIASLLGLGPPQIRNVLQRAIRKERVLILELLNDLNERVKSLEHAGRLHTAAHLAGKVAEDGKDLQEQIRGRLRKAGVEPDF